ncbi:hypothetical protein [Streptomyces sp. NPDC014734]|uniref:hypothetical protein n=1 Tax=Streptomyces sp. NPDC014734 TaxID=3364886 RepID=UPI0037026242
MLWTTEHRHHITDAPTRHTGPGPTRTAPHTTAHRRTPPHHRTNRHITGCVQ